MSELFPEAMGNLFLRGNHVSVKHAGCPTEIYWDHFNMDKRIVFLNKFRTNFYIFLSMVVSFGIIISLETIKENMEQKNEMDESTLMWMSYGKAVIIELTNQVIVTIIKYECKHQFHLNYAQQLYYSVLYMVFLTFVQTCLLQLLIYNIVNDW